MSLKSSESTSKLTLGVTTHLILIYWRWESVISHPSKRFAHKHRPTIILLPPVGTFAYPLFLSAAGQPCMKTSTPCRLFSAKPHTILCAVLLGLTWIVPLKAVTVYWTGDTSGSWGNSQNWQGFTSWVNGNAPVFNADNLTNNSISTISLGANRTAASITFASSALAQGFTFTAGSTLTVNSGITNNATNTQTFGVLIALGGAQTWAATSGSMAFTNNVSLGAKLLTLSAGTGITSSISGIVSGTGGITMAGSGQWTLSGANTYTGATTVNAGTLKAGVASVANTSGAFGRNSAVTLANTAGATLDLNNFNTQIGSLTGGGTTGGNVTLGTATLTVGGDNTSPAAYAGVISGTGGLTKTGTGTLSLSGTNTYTGATTVSQGTVQLNANAPSGSAGTLGNAVSAVTVNDANTGTNNTALLIGTSGVTVGRAVTVANAGTGTTTLGGNITSGTGDFTGNVTLNRATNLEADGTATITFRTGAIGGAGNITKVGTGTVTLSGANTYTGSTNVSAGTILANGSSSLGATAGNVAVSSGGTLALAGGAAITAGSPTNAVTITKSGTLDLNGSGASGATGALQAAGSTGQTSQWVGNITLSGNATISAADNLLRVGNGSTYANTINLGANTLTFNTTSATGVTPAYLTAPTYALDPTNILVNSQISGTGAIVKTGAGTATIISFPSNSYTGSTVVTGGKLIVDGAGGAPVVSSTSVTVGNSVSPGAANSVVLQMGQSASQPAVNNLIGSYNSGTNVATTSMTVYADGQFNLNGGSNAISSLTLQGGHVNGGNPTYNSLLTITGGVTTLASSQTALINNGALGISANAFTFNMAKGTAGTDLQIDSIVQNGVGFTNTNTSVSFAKTGAGTLTLTAANTYQGVTDIQAGILNIQNGSALGQVSPTTGGLGNGAVVETGAQLQLQGGITVGNKTLTLNGTGIANDGALLNVAGNNTYNGFILLGNASRINANTGTTLVIANPAGTGASIINGSTAGQNLTVGGAGNTTINSGVGTNIGSLTKDGTGTLTLAGSNSYTGATAVTAGAVVVTHNSGLAGTGATVSSGAALQFAQDASSSNISVPAVAATINGTGISNGGAIENLNGSNAYAGNLTLGSNARVTADTGSTLTLGGNVSGAGFGLSVGGAGNTNYNGIINGTGTTLTKTDSGTVTLDGTSANTYTGATSVNDGTLALNKTAGVNAIASGTVTIGDGIGAAGSATLLLSQSNQIIDSAAVSLGSDGKLNLNSKNETIGSMAGSGQILFGTGQLIEGGSNASTAFSGTLAGSAGSSLTKNGSGTLTISSNVNAVAGDFAGDLNLNAGGLTFSAANAFTGTLNVAAGTTLTLSNANLTVANLNFTGTGNVILDFGGASTLNILNNLTLSAGVTISIINWTNAVDYWYAANWSGAVLDTRGQSPMNQVTFDSPTWVGNNTIWQSYDHQITPVPEPSTYGALLLGAMGALLGYRRRRQAEAAVKK